MALGLPTIIEYLEGGDVLPDFEDTRAAATAFLDAPATSPDPDDPGVMIPRAHTATLATPAALALAAASTADLRALLWLLAVGVNDEVEPLGGKTYVGDVAGVPTLLIRRIPA